MGGLINPKKKNFEKLTQSYIDTVLSLNKTLGQFFNYYSIQEGNLNENTFITLIKMQNKPEIGKLLYNTFSSYNNKMVAEDIVTFYFTFALTNKEYKNKFISQFIFETKEEIIIDFNFYKMKVNMLYNNSQNNPLLEEKFLNDIIIEGKVSHFKFNNALGQKTFFQSFNIKQEKNTDKPLLFDENTNYSCDCVNHKRNQTEGTDETKEKYSQLLNQMNIKFQLYQVEGIVPLQTLTIIFSKVGINEHFTNLIIGYIKKKTLKNILDFLNFKDLITSIIFCKTDEEKYQLLFEICSFPNNEQISNEMLKLLIQVDEKTKKMITSFPKSLKKEEFFDYLSKDELLSFRETIKIIFDKINLIPYIVFEITPIDSFAIKNCIDYILENETFESFIQKHIKDNTTFYCINREFKEQLEEYYKTESEKPKINLEKIVNPEIPRRLMDNLEYNKDFIVCNENVYMFLLKCFGKENLSIDDIKLSKIEYKINDNEEIVIEDNLYHYGKELLYNKEDKLVQEVEFYPISFYYYSFKEVYFFLAKKQNKTPEELIHSVNQQKNHQEIISRKKTFQDILDKFISSRKVNLINPTLYIYYEKIDSSKPRKIEDLTKTLEDEKITTWCFFYIDSEFEAQKRYKTPVTYYQKLFEPEICNKIEEEKEQITDVQKRIEEKEKKESSMIKTTPLQKDDDNVIYPLRLSNIGNTCYLNSVIQILVNLPILRDVLLNDKIEKMINRKGKFSHNGILLDKFLEVIKLRWEVNPAKKNGLVNLKSLKDAAGIIQPRFGTFEQEDSSEFLNFMIDELHEELNIKNKRIYIPNPENEFLQNTEEELSNIYWANSIRRSASFINSLFSFQLKSILTCEVCSHSKISYETTNNLYVPIPLSMNTNISIIIFRLPFIYKIYYDTINKNFRKFRENHQEDSIVNTLSLFFNENIAVTSESDAINTSVPVQFSLTVNKNMTIGELLKQIKEMSYFELENCKEKEEPLTNLLVCSVSFRGTITFFDNKMKIDDCVQNNQKINIYEVLTPKGISIINHKTILNNNNSEEQFTPDETINTDTPNLNNTEEDNNFLISEYISQNLKQRKTPYKDDNSIHSKFCGEFPIKIEHFIQNKAKFYLFESYFRRSIPFNEDILMMSNRKENFLPLELYDFIWEKYRRFLKDPNKKNDLLWWKNPNTPSKICYPFTIKICTGDMDFKCAKCEWWRFCSGCIINPFSNVPIKIEPSCTLVIEWCGLLFEEEMIKDSFGYKIDYDKESQNKEKQNKINNEPERTLDDCMKLFLEKEKLEDELTCYKCNKRQHFYKNYQIDKGPLVLIITLKRFKYATMYNNKITTYVSFPLTNYEINNEKYDLYGVVNHMGSLNSGHYTSTIKLENTWMHFDDSRYSEIKDESNVISKNAYLLVYVNKNAPNTKMYYSIMQNILNQIETSEDAINIAPSEFFKGEPIYHEVYGKGYYIEQKENPIMSSIKFNLGMGTVKTSDLKHDTVLDIKYEEETEEKETPNQPNKIETPNETTTNENSLNTEGTKQKGENRKKVNKITKPGKDTNKCKFM